MFRLPKLLLLLAIPALLLGCDALSSNDEDTGGVVTLTGQVLNDDTNNPVSEAFVRVLPYDLLFNADADGRYSESVEVDSTMDLQVIASQDGYTDATVTVLAVAGRTIQVPTLRIRQTVGGDVNSGLAASIILLEQSANSIGVRESGSEEIAQLTFQVVDSVGRPVVLDKSTLVNFRFGSNPGDGVELAPLAAETDNNGVVTVTISSGTTAGVVQVLAETSVSGSTIRSQPVAVSIHGGMPDQTHFSIGPEKFNFPGLNIFGLENGISVILGDQYANPVRPGTAVYFTTSHAVVEGSVNTDEQGRGTVSLISANPLPGDGIAIITATTADRNQQQVMGQTPVILSGVPVLTISPGVAARNTTYYVTLTDQNGNPLVEGTVFSAKVEGTAVKGVGTLAAELPDSGFSGGMEYENVIRGQGITEFIFRAVDDVDPTATNPPTPAVEAVTVSTSGANGRLTLVLGNGAGKNGSPILSMSEDAVVTTLPDGSLQVRLTEPNR